MIKIIGVEIPEFKPLFLSLQKIKGIGCSRAKQIIKSCDFKNGISAASKISELSDDQINVLNNRIENLSFLLSVELSNFVENRIQILKDLGCYRGIRHSVNLPTRGQKTHCNAKTCKNKNKKFAKKKNFGRKNR